MFLGRVVLNFSLHCFSDLGYGIFRQKHEDVNSYVIEWVHRQCRKIMGKYILVKHTKNTT